MPHEEPNRRARTFSVAIDGTGDTASPVALLARASGLSRQAVKSAMHKGAVWLERDGHVRRLRRHKARLQAGDRLHFHHNPAVLDQEPATAILIADEGAFSVWDKPPGMRSHGSRWGDHTSLVRFAETQLQRVSFLVHRLDAAASGLILVAHSKRAARELTALFEQRRVEKIYRVRVHGCFPEAAQHYDAPLDGRPALTHARRIAYAPDTDRSGLEVSIDTGRKHQIRRHLAGAGFPVLGDRLYGLPTDRETCLALRAVAIAFHHGKIRRYSLPPGQA